MATRRLQCSMENTRWMLFRQSLLPLLCPPNSLRSYTWPQWLASNLSLRDKWEIQHLCELDFTIYFYVTFLWLWTGISERWEDSSLPRLLFHVVWWRGGVQVAMVLRSCKTINIWFHLYDPYGWQSKWPYRFPGWTFATHHKHSWVHIRQYIPMCCIRNYRWGATEISISIRHNERLQH